MVEKVTLAGNWTVAASLLGTRTILSSTFGLTIAIVCRSSLWWCCWCRHCRRRQAIDHDLTENEDGVKTAVDAHKITRINSDTFSLPSATQSSSSSASQPFEGGLWSTTEPVLQIRYLQQSLRPATEVVSGATFHQQSAFSLYLLGIWQNFIHWWRPTPSNPCHISTEIRFLRGTTIIIKWLRGKVRWRSSSSSIPGTPWIKLINTHPQFLPKHFTSL